MEAALERGDLVEAISHLETMIASTPPGDVYSCLANQTVKHVPILHYLARFPFQEEDIPRLNKLIKIFTDFGYDINQTTDKYLPSALMTSIEKKNLILMECLLRHGARTDTRDQDGYSPCHLAITMGQLKCLEKLVQFGGPSALATTSSENVGEGNVQPLLHTAIKCCRTEIVSYLLSKWEEFGVNVNQKSIYDDYQPNGKRIRLEITPLERAIRKGNVPIVQILLQHPDVKLLGFKELHLCIEMGFTKMALVLLDYVSTEQLASDKIQDKWTLHCLSREAFYKESRVEFTKKLILEYVRRGWDINSVSGFPKETTSMWSDNVTFSRCTLLHLACRYCAEQGLINLLVEAGADINIKTEGDQELTPLQISLTMGQWTSCAYFVYNGADLNVRGSFKNGTRFLRVMRTSTTGPLENQSISLNAVELLLSMRYEEGRQLLNYIFSRPKYVWNGANEFYMAMEGGSPVYIYKVLRHCAEFISVEELSWLTFRKTNGGIPEKVPTLLYLLGNLSRNFRGWRDGGFDFVDVSALARLIKILVSLGYDLNLSKERSHDTTISTERILAHILKIDYQQYSPNILLRTVLQVDHFRLNEGCRPFDLVEALLSCDCITHFSVRSLYPSLCWKDKPLPPPTAEAAKLLVTHGMDVTGMVIDADFTYHFGYNSILKMLYCAGAQISEEFFTSPKICHPGHPETQGFLQEIAEVKKWKDEFDRKEGSNLKHLCRLRVRKMMGCIGDLKKLDGLPGSLKDYILCKTQF